MCMIKYNLIKYQATSFLCSQKKENSTYHSGCFTSLTWISLPICPTNSSPSSKDLCPRATLKNFLSQVTKGTQIPELSLAVPFLQIQPSWHKFSSESSSVSFSSLDSSSWSSSSSSSSSSDHLSNSWLEEWWSVSSSSWLWSS